MNYNYGMETKEFYQERNKEIKHLRHDELMSLQEIGNKYSISRERVRQIIGKKATFYSSLYFKAKIKANSHNFLEETSHLTNGELASLLEIKEESLYSIVKDRGKIRHAIRDGSCKIGATWEIWVSDVLNQKGFLTELMPHSSPYDILVSDVIRIDVKTSITPVTCPSKLRITQSPSYRFNLNRHNKYKCDFYLLIVAKSEDIFIVPHANIPLHQTDIFMCWPTLRPEIGKYQKYLYRFDLLQTYLTDNKKSL